MKAAVFHGPHQDLTIEDVDVAKPGPREVLVKTAASGVCHSDLHFVEGLYPFQAPGVLGHEAAGIVEEAGELVQQFKAGDHVIMCLSVFCGNCSYCLSGRPNLCRSPETQRRPDEDPRLSWNGNPVAQFANLSTYAEYTLVHENALVYVDDEMPLDKAALIGCGVMTGAGAALNTAKVHHGSTVAVFGAGGVGLSAIQGARIAGAKQIIAVDLHEHKLALARELGATHSVDASSGDPVTQIQGMTDGEGVDFSFEAIGLKSVAEQCFAAIKRGGVATIIGMVPLGQKLEIPAHELLSEKVLQGSSMGSNRFRTDMPNLVEYYRQGRLMLDEMVTQTAPLEDINEAFRAMKAGEVARTVLTSF